MERTGVHFMFLCFVLIALLSLVASEYKLYNSRNRLKYAGTQYVESADVAEIYIHYLVNNKCKFFIVEKAIFYACPKRPTRFPFLHNEVFRLDNDDKDRGVEYSHSEKFKCPFPFGTHPHPKECRKYYLCIFDKPRTMTCESSMLYDEYKGECAKKSSVDCGDRIGDVTTKGTTPAPGQKTTSEVKTTTKKVEKFKCPYTWGTFPNPENCAQFYLCLNKRHTLKKCKPTELYDTKANECRDEDQVDCGSRFNPREKTSTTTAATTSSPTTDVTTIMEESTTTIFEESTSQTSSGNTSDEGATESSTSIEVSPSSELKTTFTYETESTTGEITSEEPAQFTEDPDVTDDDNSETDGPQSTTEKPEITGENTSGTIELEPSSEPPIITDVVTSGTKEPESTSENSRITDDDISDTKETELTSEESLEVTGTTSKPTDEDSFVSQDPDSKSTTSGKFSSTDNSSDHSEESETPLAETTPSTEPRSSLPDDNTVSDENSTDGEEKTDYATEEISISFQPETETTAEEKITPEISQATEDIRESSSSTDEVETSTTSSETPKSFVCPRNKGYYPHKDCSMYYVCSEGTYTIEQCPRGTLFHVIHGMCDNEDDVDCEDRIRPDRDNEETEQVEISSTSLRQDREETSTKTEDPASFVCPKKKGIFAHPIDCASYYSCRNGEAKLVKCLPGLLFSVELTMCYTDSEVDCESRRRTF